MSSTIQGLLEYFDIDHNGFGLVLYVMNGKTYVIWNRDQSYTNLPKS